MANYYLPEDGAHYYFPDGRPCHTVPNLSKPGTERNTTLADAKKLGLLKSISVVLRVIEKPALTAYKINQHLRAAFELERGEGEDDDHFARRVIDRAGEHAGTAAAFGTRMHEYIEYKLSDGQLPEPLLTMGDWPVLGALGAWLERYPIVVESLERNLAREDLNIGGRVDCVGEIPSLGVPLSIIDWKSQGVLHKPKRKINWPYFTHYREHKFQTAGYSLLDGRGLPTCVVYVASDVPGMVEVVKYPAGAGLVGFTAARLLWDELYWNEDDAIKDDDLVEVIDA